MKFSSPNACTLGISNIGSRNAQYSTDAKTWTDWDGTAISFGNGTDLYVRGNNLEGWNKSSTEYAKFTMTGSEVSCEGNIMHMLSYEEDLDTIPCDYCFVSMFYNCSSLVDASKLELPSTTLTKQCYYDMFDGCKSLTAAPSSLPATTLANNCYGFMFQLCTSLVNAPELPATALSSYCYYNMFRDCSSLVNAPELPATTLAKACYSDMFYGCSSLVDAPELPATTLAKNCYRNMFKGCSNLNHIKMMGLMGADGVNYVECFNGWMDGVSGNGTLECGIGKRGIIPGVPSGWTIVEVAA